MKPHTSHDEAAHHLDAAIDSLVQARLSLSSCEGGGPETWYPPLSALVTATESDPEWRRHEARVKEVVARLEAMSPDLEPHLYELQRAAVDLSERAGQVGLAVGASLAVGGRHLDGEPDDSAARNREG